MLSPSPTGVSSETGSSISSKSSRTRSGVNPLSAAISSIVGSRLSFWASCRRERRAPPNLFGDVDGQADRAALVGERTGDCLANPPGRVGRKLEAKAVVELLDGADQAEVALLDQVEQRNAGIREVAGDRHDQPQVRLDQTSFGRLVAHVLAARELSLLAWSQQPAVADLADVQLQRIGGLQALVVGQRCDLELIFLFFFRVDVSIDCNIDLFHVVHCDIDLVGDQLIRKALDRGGLDRLGPRRDQLERNVGRWIGLDAT